MQFLLLQERWTIHTDFELGSSIGHFLLEKHPGLVGLGHLHVQDKGGFAVQSRLVLLLAIFGSSVLCFVSHKLRTFHCSDTNTSYGLQERKERKQTFLDPDDVPMTLDDAMSALLEVGGHQFKTNVELYGAVHTDELRYTLASPDW